MTVGPAGILQMLGLPEALVDQCREILQEQATSVKGGGPAAARAGVFGGSPHGQALEHHTSVAHQHVVDALHEMAAGLQGYAENLHDFAKDLDERDFEAAAALTPSRKRELLDAGGHLNSHDLHDDGGTGAAGGAG